MAIANLKITYASRHSIHQDSQFMLPESFFENIHTRCEQSNCSELLNFHQHTKSKDKIRIRQILRAPMDTPFMFISCLN